MGGGESTKKTAERVEVENERARWVGGWSVDEMKEMKNDEVKGSSSRGMKRETRRTETARNETRTHRE